VVFSFSFSFSSPKIQNFPKTVEKSFKRKDEWVDGSVVLFSYREEGEKKRKKGKRKKI
jgi:hypothetical protein